MYWKSVLILMLAWQAELVAQYVEGWHPAGKNGARTTLRPADSTLDVTPIGTQPLQPVSQLGPLSHEAGQVWREYDIRAFTRRNRDQSQPQQTIVDWILRETGTKTWFGNELSVLNANRDLIRVYHSPAVQAKVKRVIDRFLNSRSEANEVAVRLVTVDQPEWRVKAISVLTPVATQSAGIEAWLVSRENAALLLHELEKRPDFQEHNSPNLTVYSGQTHTISSKRPRTYLAGEQPTRGFPTVKEIDEGFTLQISPLVHSDGQSVEAVIKCRVNQIERFTPLRVNNVDQFGMYRQSQIEIPQMSSWQIHERFRWPKDEVLLISRGVVANPGPIANGGVRRLIGSRPRANALLFLESRSEIGSKQRQESMASRTDAANYRGRY